MADLSDVQSALAAVIQAAIYPAGLGAASVSGKPIVIYPGWPTASRLDDDLVAGKCHVTIFPTQIERNVSRYPKDWQPQTLNVATITASIAGQTLVIAGAMPSPFTPHNVVALISDKPYVYPVQQSDAIAGIASALAALIAPDWPGTSAAGGTITLPATAVINAVRIGVTGTSTREIRRQERVFQISVWADSPAARDAIAQALDVALAGIEFLTMPDGYAARLIYRNSNVIDSLQKAKLYRRDFQYSVEYATTQTDIGFQITQEQINVSSKSDAATSYDTINTKYL